MSKRTKRLIASKGPAQLVQQSGRIYVFPTALATCGKYLGTYTEVEKIFNQMKADGWTIH